MSGIVLYDYWRSSASYRVRIALNLCGLSYRIVPVDLLSGAHRGAEHLNRNPQGLVPALEIDGVMLTQSLAIIDYLAEAHGLACLPGDPVQRARTRALAQSLAVDVHPVCNLSVVAHAETLSDDPNLKTNWMKRFIRPGLEAFSALLKGFPDGPFCTGPEPGLADLCLIPQLYNARRWGVAYDDLDRVSTIERACETLTAFRDAHPDRVRPHPASPNA